MVPGSPYVCGEYRRRFFFLVRLDDEDFAKIASPNSPCAEVVNLPAPPALPSPASQSAQSASESSSSSPSSSIPPAVSLALSSEHTSWLFCKDLLVASTMIKLHSGAVPAEALIMAMRRTDWKKEGRGKLVDRITSTDFEEERWKEWVERGGGGGGNIYGEEEEDDEEDEEEDEEEEAPLAGKGGSRHGGGGGGGGGGIFCGGFFGWCARPEKKGSERESVLVLPPPRKVPVRPRGR